MAYQTTSAALIAATLALASLSSVATAQPAVQGTVIIQSDGNRGSYRPQPVYQVIPAPPPPRREAVPRPRRGQVWEEGHWDWRGNRHVWVAGHWVKARPGYVYRQPTWQEREGRWEMRRGGWDRDGDGVPNRYDRDRDGDGVANRNDRDRDGDGVSNRRDSNPDNPRRN